MKLFSKCKTIQNINGKLKIKFILPFGWSIYKFFFSDPVRLEDSNKFDW